MSPNNGKLITIEEAATLLRVSTKTIRNYIQKGILISSKVLNDNKRRQIMILEGSLLGPSNKESNRSFQTVPSSQGLPGKNSNKEALTQATFRIGWLEGQLELTRRMLTEGAEVTKQREEALLRGKTLAEQKARELETQVAVLQTALQKTTRRHWWEFWKPKPDFLETPLPCG